MEASYATFFESRDLPFVFGPFATIGINANASSAAAGWGASWAAGIVTQ